MKFWSLLVSAVMVVNSFSIFAAETNKEIVIYHTNDTHGYVTSDDEKIIGMAIVGALKDDLENAILVDAGDATQGLPIASLTQGADTIELMNIAGYDLMTIGNHEFDFGKENLINNIALAQFPIISANIYENNRLFLDGLQESTPGCHMIIERDGIKIGFFGITTTQTKTATNPTEIKGIEFKDEIEIAKKEIEELKAENVDAIIAICHMGDDDATCTSTMLAQALPEGDLDVIIDGHSHTVENKIENETLIVQTGYGLNAVGKLTLEIRDDDVSATGELLHFDDLQEIEPKAEVVAKLEEINTAQEEILSEVIGTLPTTLWAGWINDLAMTRMVETNYGDLATDAFKAETEKIANGLPVVAVENGGGIREAAPLGELTKGTLISAFPFSNTLYVKEVTPKILYEVMEVSGACLDGQNPETGMLLQQTLSGGFLQVAGCTVEFNPDNKEQKVTAITLDGQNEPLDREDTETKILLVSNNFIMNGGNDYTMLTDIEKIAEIGGELEIIQNYIKENLNNGVLEGYSKMQNRILMKGNSYVPQEYIASIKVTDNDFNPVANKELSYTIDGSETLTGMTDEDGLLKLTLSDGAHGVKIGNGMQVYIDNYTGIGITEIHSVTAE